MSESGVKLGEGVADGLKDEANQKALQVVKAFIDVLSKYLNDKIQKIDFDEWFGKLSKKDGNAIVSLWSSRLAEEGLIPNGYVGLPDGSLVDNLHQDGYLDGLYVGYALAMMSLADNHASTELIVSVRDDIRPKLLGHHYKDREELLLPYKDGKYGWIERLSKEDCS